MYLQKEMLKLSKVYKERIRAFIVKKLKRKWNTYILTFRKKKLKTSTNLGKQAPTYASMCVFSLRIMEGQP